MEIYKVEGYKGETFFNRSAFNNTLKIVNA